MDPNQNPQDGEKTENMAPLGRQHTYLSISTLPAFGRIPEQVRELKPIAIVDNQGNLVGLQVVNLDGGPQTNVMDSNQICGGAIIHKGNYNDLAGQINLHKCPYHVLTLSSSRHWNLAMAVGMRSAPMTLRFVSSVNRDAKPIDLVDGNKGENDESVVILMPRGVPFARSGHPPIPINGPRPRLVMEGMLVGRHHAEASEICQFYFKELQ
ncbi:uncharacterized protein FTJAE_4249 [Fusarium tjaetaba]|uniref:Uncharacterized protein n=1 Tax=Fusarium tjaetaba TaxID=1567544 RepID=A0A8H5RWE9_9HYPO|nr:uncharacterized protein FTJAE_4249 [Fusarium tjaetaba]KAF5641067.1 hypothetical protein FTJAE_4249 [Fusarium tjaetaba]